MRMKQVKRLLVMLVGVFCISSTSMASSGISPEGMRLKEMVKNQYTEMEKKEQNAEQENIHNHISPREKKEIASMAKEKKVRKLMEKRENKSGKIKYKDYYGGSYIDENGELVLQLCDPTEQELQEIKEVLGEEIQYQQTDNSYQELDDEIERQSQLLSDLQEKNFSGELVGEEKKLADSLVGMGTDVVNNKNIVYMTDISEEMQMLYKNYFGITDVSFEKMVRPEENAVEMKQGAKLYSPSIDGYISLGPRMEYTRNSGNVVEGFMTAGHGTKVYGNKIYFVKANGDPIEVGTVIKRQNSGSVDAAFVQLTNNDYTVSRYTKYIDANGTKGDSYKMCNDCFYGEVPSVGKTVYKSGATSYLTSSTVVNTNVSITFTSGVTINNLIMTSTKFSQSGDSGSNVFTRDHGNVYDTIGLLTGSGPSNSYVCNMTIIDQVWENQVGYPLMQY